MQTVNETDGAGKTALYRAIFGYRVLGSSNSSYLNTDCLPVVQRLLGAGACKDTGGTYDRVRDLRCYKDEGVWHPCSEGVKMNLLNHLNGRTSLPKKIQDRKPHASIVRRMYEEADHAAQVSRALAILGIGDVPRTQSEVKQIAMEVSDNKPNVGWARDVLIGIVREQDAKVRQALVILDIKHLPQNHREVKQIASAMWDKPNVDWARDVLIGSIREQNGAAAAAAGQPAAAAIADQPAAAAIAGQPAAAASRGSALMRVEDREASSPVAAMMAPAGVAKKTGQHCEECGKSWKEVHGGQARSYHTEVRCGRQRYADLQHLLKKSADRSLVEDCDKLVDQIP